MDMSIIFIAIPVILMGWMYWDDFKDWRAGKGQEKDVMHISGFGSSPNIRLLILLGTIIVLIGVLILSATG